MINKIFASSVNKHPNNIAFQYKNQQLTYKQVNELVGKFTNYLLRNNIRLGDPVIINIESPIWRAIAFLSCARIGAAYIPISQKKNSNIAYNQSIIKHCSPKLILYSSQEATELKNQSVAKNFNNDIINEILKESPITKTFYSINNERDTLYISHSSGTTGRPKGIPIVNAGMGYWEKELLDAWRKNDNDPMYHNVLGNANSDFDVHIWELLMAIIAGGKIQFTEEYQRNSSAKLIQFLIKNRITDATLTPSVVHMFSDEDFLALKKSGLKNLYVTGEACTPEISEKCKKYGINLYNCYGATEETFGLSMCLCDPRDFYRHIAPIAIPKSQEITVIIVDKNDRQVEDGQEGELVVISPYLTKDYIPNNTKASNNIQSTVINGKPYRIFKTGDKFVKYKEKLYFLGRVSNLQDIKINGQKVNVTGISNVLRTNHNIKDCAIILKNKVKNKDPYLIAYIVANESSEITVMELREWCKNRLSSYEIPTYFIFVKNLPQTDNGKTDLNKLKEANVLLNRSKRTPDYLLPVSTIEASICNITRETLEFPTNISLLDPIEFISPKSLDYMKLISNIEEFFGIDDLSSELLKKKNPTIKDLSESVYKLLCLKNRQLMVRQVKNGKSDLPPIIIIHPITPESVKLYHDFYSNLKTDREVYVINAPAIQYPQLVTDEIPTIADTYIEAIKREIPRCRNGEYTLVGYSSGANIAREMRSQLEKNNNQVGRLIVIDEPSIPSVKSAYGNEFDNTLIRFVYNLQREMKGAFNLPPNVKIMLKNKELTKEDKIHYLFSKIIEHNEKNNYPSKKFKNMVIGSLRHAEFLLIAELHCCNDTKLKSDIDLFFCNSTIEKHKDKTMGWKNTTSGTTSSHVYNGSDHFNILKNKNLIADINEVLRTEENKYTSGKGMEHIKKLLQQMQENNDLTDDDRENLSNYIKNISLNSPNPKKMRISSCSQVNFKSDKYHQLTEHSETPSSTKSYVKAISKL